MLDFVDSNIFFANSNWYDGFLVDDSMIICPTKEMHNQEIPKDVIMPGTLIYIFGVHDMRVD